jgi:putative redox protein
MMAGQVMAGRLEWKEGLRFAGSVGHRSVELDGNAQAGCSPMEMLLLSLAGCMAIDVIHILGKMRAGVKSLKASVEGVRAQSEPRRFTRIALGFEVGGSDVKDADVERAIKLSREKYCSVVHSLRSDISIETTYRLIA